ncbi:hypothetical protein ACKAV7_012002 [Fusarium commune]
MIPKHDADMTKEHVEEYKKWLGELFETGDCSNLQLHCGTKTYAAHRTVVFHQSPKIKKEHTPPGGLPPGFRHPSSSGFPNPIGQYRRARDAKVGTGVMYKEDAIDDTMIPLGSDLITHIRVFALAEEYGIHPLKSLSVAKFEAAAQHYGKTHYFTDAAQEAYNSAALDNTREMRDSVVEFLHKRRYLLYEDHVKRLMLDKPQLSLDLHLHGPIIPTNSSSLPGRGRGFHQIKK